MACARRMPRLDSLAEEISAFGGKFKGVELDIGDIDAFASSRWPSMRSARSARRLEAVAEC